MRYYWYYNSLHKALPSTTVYYKACRNYFPVLLCTTQHKARSSTTLYYKACTNTSQYYCVLQSLQKLLPSTALYYKACTNYFPVLLCSTNLAQSTQYYKSCTNYFPFVVQTRSSTTVYYKACRNTFQYYRILQSLHTVVLERVCASFVVYGSTGTCFCKLCSIQ